MIVTESQRDHIQAYITSSDFGGGYRYIVSLIDSDPDQSVAAEVRTWFAGAADVNQSIGAFSAFIRNYTAQQYLSRTGSIIPSGALQAASNGIASQVLTSIIETGNIPSLHDIGVNDISGTSAIFAGDTKAWSGNLLFGMLGDASFYDANILDDPSKTYDLLVAMRSAFASLGSVNDTIGDLYQVISTAASLLLPPGTFSAGTVLGMVNRTNSFLYEAYGLTIPEIAGLRILVNQQNASSTILGTPNSDIIHGSDGQDIIIASDGGDIIDGGLGNDSVDYLGYTNPIIFDIGNGDMSSSVRFTATATNQQTQAQDLIFDTERLGGSKSADTFNIDSLRHDQTVMILMGNDGDDTFNLNTLPFNDKNLTIYGDVGADTLSLKIFKQGAVFQIDTLSLDGTYTRYFSIERFIGTAGNDQFFFASTTPSFVDGGDGIDLVDFTASSIAVTIQSGVFSNIEQVRGSAFSDVLVGQANMTMFGGNGDDLFVSVAARTKFIGRENSDSDSNSTRGTDTLSFNISDSGLVIDMHQGIASNGDTFEGMEHVVGTAFDDTFVGPTNFQQFGNLGTAMHGGAGNDYIELVPSMEGYGDDGNDIFAVIASIGNVGYNPPNFPGSSSPTVKIHGGAGYDVIDFKNSADLNNKTITIFSGSGSVDQMVYDGIEEFRFDAYFVNINGGAGNEVIRGGTVASTIHGGVGDDVIYARGSAQDALYGDIGNDILFGNGGDEIHGGAGDDIIYAGASTYQSHLYGGDGNDTIYGGDGNDVIYAGRGSDNVYGGGGVDYVNYTSSDGNLVSITNQGSYFEAVFQTTEGYQTDRLYGCEFLFINGNGWELTPDFSYPIL